MWSSRPPNVRDERSVLAWYVVSAPFVPDAFDEFRPSKPTLSSLWRIQVSVPVSERGLSFASPFYDIIYLM
jgi:hypothetical protein